jgi:hypothetical protein
MVQVLEMKYRLKNAKCWASKSHGRRIGHRSSPSSEMLFSADALFHITISHHLSHTTTMTKTGQARKNEGTRHNFVDGQMDGHTISIT